MKHKHTYEALEALLDRAHQDNAFLRNQIAEIVLAHPELVGATQNPLVQLQNPTLESEDYICVFFGGYYDGRKIRKTKLGATETIEAGHVERDIYKKVKVKKRKEGGFTCAYEYIKSEYVPLT